MNESNKNRIAAINSDIIPEGYKKTKVGIVPVEWETKTLGQVLHRVSNAVNVENDIQYQQIGIRSHGKGLFYKEKVSGAELGNKSVFWIEPDCFILNIVFAWEQAIGKTTKNEIGMIASHRFPMYKPQGIDIDYLVFYFLTKRGNTLLELASPGGAGRNKTLGQENFLNSKVILPPLSEQQKIAEILSTQDKLIELQEKKIEQLKELKKAYLQKMFPKKGSKYPELRFKGFTDPWEQRKVGDTYNVTRGYVLAAPKTSPIKTDEKPFPVYSSQTKDNGLMGYYNEYLYENAITWTTDGANAGTVNFRAGKFYCTNVCGVLLSDAGYSNKAAAEALNMVAWKWVSHVGNPKLMNNVMTEIEISLPPTVQEQEKISEFLTSLDTLITLHQRKSEQEKQKKKALMQLLLTGKVRCI